MFSIFLRLYVCLFVFVVVVVDDVVVVDVVVVVVDDVVVVVVFLSSFQIIHSIFDWN